jgi:hypothetical protein
MVQSAVGFHCPTVPRTSRGAHFCEFYVNISILIVRLTFFNETEERSLMTAIRETD